MNIYEMAYRQDLEKHVSSEEEKLQQQLDDTNAAWFRDKLLIEIAIEAFDKIINVIDEKEFDPNFLRKRDTEIAEEALRILRK